MGNSRARRPSTLPEAQARIRAAGERVTGPRCAVLAALLDAESALTHHEIESTLAKGDPVDRVTVYRVLDWLVALGLAHRIAGEDRAWRFHASRGASARPHAHFTCSRCGKTVCLEDVAVPAAVSVPQGFLPQGVEVTVKGLCAACH